MHYSLKSTDLDGVLLIQFRKSNKYCKRIKPKGHLCTFDCHYCTFQMSDSGKSESNFTNTIPDVNSWFQHFDAKLTLLLQVQRNRLHASSGFIICLTDIQDCAVEENVFYGQGDKTISSDEATLCTAMSNEIQPVPERSKDWYVIWASYMLQDVQASKRL